MPSTTYLPHGVAIACSSDDAARPGVDYIDLAVVELDAATAYLDELTGTGLLALPPGVHSPDPATLDELDRLGWLVLDGNQGFPAIAGRTTGGNLVLCLYADFAVTPEPDRTTLHNTLTALHFAAGLLENP
ncbi:hypothetical protein BWI15_10285 [Kribbella sp. ALI-6-A]|nr:hypothetical protein BWI15_10285 [Kribbella sp. ALI-6-A]